MVERKPKYIYSYHQFGFVCQLCEQLFDDLSMSDIKGFDCNYSVYKDDMEFNNELYEIFLEVVEPEQFNRNRP